MKTHTVATTCLYSYMHQSYWVIYLNVPVSFLRIPKENQCICITHFTGSGMLTRYTSAYFDNL